MSESPPGRIAVALDWLRLVVAVRTGNGEGITCARELRSDELALERACIEQLRLYVSGESRVEAPERVPAEACEPDIAPAVAASQPAASN